MEEDTKHRAVGAIQGHTLRAMETDREEATARRAQAGPPGTSWPRSPSVRLTHSP
jgi:hypothetical protein